MGLERTPEPSPLRVAKIVTSEENEAWVGLTMAPGRTDLGVSGQFDRSLENDLQCLIDLGATTIVPLVTDEELPLIGIPDLFDRARGMGLEVRRFPFHDGGIPSDLEETLTFIDELEARFHRGERLVVHCRGGLGRAGTIGACLRLRMGMDSEPDGAIASIRELRNPRAIETAGQEAFIERFWSRISD
jgi:ADP-ribosyl-[dinitrogen reductase] hydrolase